MDEQENGLMGTLSKALIQRGELQAELAELRVLYADRDADLAFEYKRAEEAETENAQLRAALGQVEFVQQQPNLPRVCPWCYGVWKHNDPCARQLALGLQEARTP